MKEFMIPFSILLIAFFVYFLFIGKGAFFLPTKEMVSHQKIGQSFSPNPVNSPSSQEESKEGYTLESIFKSPHQLPVRSGLPVISLIATGDVIPARSVNYQVTTRKDFTWPYLKTAQILKEADITFINLETPLIKNCPLTQEGMNFCGDSRNIEGLVYAGVDVASLANNHAANKGKAGVDETIAGLEKAGIKSVGAKNNPAIVEVRGIKFAFLGYNDIEKTPLVTSADEKLVEKEIADAKKNADVVVVQFHWGTEYKTEVEDRQKELGHLAVDLGADCFTASLIANPSILQYGGGTSTLTWNSLPGGISCSSPDFSTGNAPNGSVDVNLTTTTTYHLTCQDGNGNTATPETTVVVLDNQVVNGVCSPQHFNCVAGTSIRNRTGINSWTWQCQGINGGTTASCSENFPVFECSDGIDNDTDTLIDTADPGCHTDGDANNAASYDPNDNTENNTVGVPQCSDGIDNDGDKKIDFKDEPTAFPAGIGDSGCSSAIDNSESNNPKPKQIEI
jgi:hypothetical protein